MLPILLNMLVEAQPDRINFTATDLEQGIQASPSSLLLLILMLWSIPVLIYAILFFPELQQLISDGRGVHTSRKALPAELVDALTGPYLKAERAERARRVPPLTVRGGSGRKITAAPY
jgi:hypothetical protein